MCGPGVIAPPQRLAIGGEVGHAAHDRTLLRDALKQRIEVGVVCNLGNVHSAECRRAGTGAFRVVSQVRTEGGIPEGTVIQLDPSLDLSKFPLTREERIVCVALQRYGMVLVDIAQGQPVYAEGLWGHPGRSWKGKLRSTGGLSTIPYSAYRMLKAGPPTYRGDGRSKFAPVWDDPRNGK